MHFGNDRERQIYEKLVLNTYFDAADEDYLAARLLWYARLSHSFSWHAAQAIEKFVKSGLLFNGLDAKFGHDVLDGFRRLRTCAAGLLPDYLAAPDGLELLDGFQFKEDFEHYVGRVSRNGHTDSRYRETEVETEAYDIVKLDIAVKLLRRLSIDLEEYDHGTQFREILRSNPDKHVHAFKRQWLRTIPENFLLHGNYAIAPNPVDRPLIGGSWHLRGQAICIAVDLDVRNAVAKLSQISRFTQSDLLKLAVTGRRQD